MKISLRFLLVCVGVMWASVLHAETHALLIGVSGYPSLPSALRLSGPRNDVITMENALQHLGVRDITILADGVAASRAEPTRAAILEHFARLAQALGPGDWAVVYFSGHGSQQPQPAVLPPGTYIEPDGLDEIFLPLDVKRWDLQTGTVTNGLIDDEIGHALDALLNRGALVWAIFDTCHAGDMVKAWPVASPNGVTRVWRRVPPNVLGVPPLAPGRAARAHKSALAALAIPKTLAGNARRGQLVAFYASHPDGLAAEKPLIPSDTGKRMSGVFTWYLAAAMEEYAAQPHTSFAAVMDVVAARSHAAGDDVFSTPYMEGPGRLEMAFGSTTEKR